MVTPLNCPVENAGGPKEQKQMTLVASDVRRPGEPLVAGTRPSRSVPARPAKAARGESRGFGRWLLESGLYSHTLGYASPRSFFASGSIPFESIAPGINPLTRTP